MLSGLIGYLLAPWFLPLCGLIYSFYFLYRYFDPIHQRNAQPQNVSHYQLPPNQKPSKAVGDPDLMYFYCSATELGRFIREKRITSTLLVKKYIERLIHVNSSINAAVHYRFSQALDEALLCDDIITQLTNIYQQLQSLPLSTTLEFNIVSYPIETYPLLTTILTQTTSLQLFTQDETLYTFLTRYLPPFFGVPCTTKECFALKGLPHTAGLVSRRHQLASYTAPVILNMQRSGLVIIATSNTSELCMWMESQNLVYGQTRNPYNLKRTPGGSSGGEGALLGSLSTPISLGSDVGGSIRMPAFFNGIYGHKPTSMTVSCLGQVPSSRGGIPDYFCQAGPMARYPADLWPLLQIMTQTHNVPVFINNDEKLKYENKTVLNLNAESGVLGDIRTVNLLQRPLLSKADVQVIQNEYSTTHEGETIIDLTSKHFHNPHGISGRYQQLTQHQFNTNKNQFISLHGQDNVQISEEVQRVFIDGEDAARESITETLLSPSFLPFNMNNNNSNNTNAQNTTVQQNIIDQPSEDVKFMPYPHQNSKYYEFNALKSHTQENFPHISSTHPLQSFYNATTHPQNTTLKPITTITPYQIDTSQVIVYSLRSFGTSFPPISAVDPILLSKQHDAAQFYANMGCTVYEIDVDELIAYYKQHQNQSTTTAQSNSNPTTTSSTTSSSTDKVTGVYQLQKNPNFFIPRPNHPTFTDLQEQVPIPQPISIDPFLLPQVQVFTEFVHAFEYWSAGMTLTFSAFRELLLQDCTTHSMKHIDNGKNKKDTHVTTDTTNTTTTTTTTIPSSPTIDSAHDSDIDYTSHEYLNQYSSLDQTTINSLPLPQYIIYMIIYFFATIFHTIRNFLIRVCLPLEGIPHFHDHESDIETKRQLHLEEYLRQQRENGNKNKNDKNNNEITLATYSETPSIKDIAPPIPFSVIETPSMPIIKRVRFEIRVAIYLCYHMCLSCCSKQLIPVGTRCLAQTQGHQCWHDVQPIPPCIDTDLTNQELTNISKHSPTVNKTNNNSNMFHKLSNSGLDSYTPKDDDETSSSGFGTSSYMRDDDMNDDGEDFTRDSIHNIDDSQPTSPNDINKKSSTSLQHAHSHHITTESSNTIISTPEHQLPPITFNNGHHLIMNPRPITQLVSLCNNNSNEITTTFQTTTYPLYMANKNRYPYCNCTHVLQSAKQTKILAQKYNITIISLIASFLPMTPYTFPALLLALIDRVGDLTPEKTLISFQKCLSFGERINSLLSPNPSQPFGAVILAPPHPKQAPPHFVPCYKPFNFIYTGIFNATMSPVTSAPTGLYKNLPTGVQIVGGRHCDVTTIAMALLLHEQFGGWQPSKRLHSKYHVTK